MKFKPLFLTSILFATCLTGCAGAGKEYAISEYKAGEVSVNAEEGIKILQLTDIHLSNKDNQQLQLDFIALTINEAKKDGVNLIVLTGDTFTFADKTTAKMFFKYLDSFEVPWTLTFGNHDEQCYFSVTWLTSFLTNYDSQYCMFKDLHDDNVHGDANFYIDVKAKDNSVFERVVIFDSNRYYFSDYMGYDYIKPDQIEWYKKVVTDTGASGSESICFFHIPLPEYETAMNLYDADHSTTEVKYLGGEHYEGVSCPKYNSGLFDVMVGLRERAEATSPTKFISVGHDHENDVGYLYKGIVLNYGRNSTDRIYSHEGRVGGTLITISKDHQYNIKLYTHEYSEVEGK